MKKLIVIIFFIQFNLSFAQIDLWHFMELKSQTDSLSGIDSTGIFNLNIYSNFDSSDVYIDSQFMGKTPVTDFKLKKGEYKIKLINPNPGIEWQNSNQLKDLNFTKDTTLNINFQYFYYLNSEPYNANILRADTLFGFTPLRFFSETKLTGNFVFRKKNYMDFVFDINDYNFETGAEIKLQTAVKSGSNEVVYKNRGTQFKTKRNLPAILLLGAAAVTGAYFAIDFKNSANEAYNEYTFTGNNSKLDESNTNDTNFAISVVLMQLAIGGLIYFLFFD
ncbi:MAG TPA: PEGA domain-containing protein [Ignavibacteria bacterium]|nr:PEGA domain-containing protein [Ignavibacteria bacterium]